MAWVCNTRMILIINLNVVSFHNRNENRPFADETDQKTATEGSALPKGPICQPCRSPQGKPQQVIAGYRGYDGWSGRSHHPDCHYEGS